MTVTLIAAVGPGGVIGDGERLPWHLPAELAHFKATTLGHTLLMGRRTFDSVGRALPGRHTVVLTRDLGWRHADVEVAHSLEQGLALAGPSEVFVAGGAEVYRAALPFATRLVISHVDVDAVGSVHFPDIDPAVWTEASRHERDGFTVVEYLRRAAPVADDSRRPHAS